MDNSILVAVVIAVVIAFIFRNEIAIMIRGYPILPDNVLMTVDPLNTRSGTVKPGIVHNVNLSTVDNGYRGEIKTMPECIAKCKCTTGCVAAADGK